MKLLLLTSILFLCGIQLSCAKSLRTLDFSYYWSLDEINEYIHDLGQRFPEITEVEEMGITDENRTIFGIRIVNNQNLAERNFSMPILMITGGASARDWISVMAAINIIHELVEHYNEFQILVDYLEWFVIPCLNPDGFVFSQTEGNREWVKTRKVLQGTDCIGVNIERNFNIYWDSGSDDPCSDEYRGPVQTSEEATRLLEFFFYYTSRVQESYISIQAGIPNSFNGNVAYPFAHSSEAIPDNWERKRNIANDMSASINRLTGARYRTGSAANLAGQASGTSTDYATTVTETPLAFTVFAPAGGRFGYDVEEWRINPIVDQIFAAIEDLARHLIFSPTND
ncbi:hypothetical protein PVAND_007032 [Polypedilum vanderplanki]|uniref:Peptidase M14 domain-containing protein n=1 Tax=Polypedilum vanderplanki TaxID=319348 RepID=A0A9J6C5T1_POLVA|nr:hypothetical protein PVAND_007032 [Polypedilum vanderplanki]